MAKVSVQIVTWNSMRYIFDCIESLMRQSYRDFSIMIIDNGSDDKTVEFVRTNYPTVSVLQNFRNLGYAKANNQGIHLASGEYVLVVNPDVILEDDFLEQLVQSADRHPEAGSFAGKILKLTTEAIDGNDEAGLREAIKSDFFDCAGLTIKKSRTAINRGEGSKDVGQFNRAEEVFGHSGACVLFRKSALNDVMIKNEFFDQNFGSYKEDVDLAWRLRLYGFSAWYIPSAVCYHYRRLAVSSGNSLRAIIKHRRQTSTVLRSMSFRNQRLMLIKNDQFSNIIAALPWILTREITAFIYSLLFERFEIKNYFEVIKLFPTMMIKRKVIMAHKKVTANDIRRWFK
ncbi:MAG: glycosyltransferase family 2 protein [Patescibacteria group bacterium]|nr:glycosyltransferase family 2 protein [Patescibacteria group bacterium]